MYGVPNLQAIMTPEQSIYNLMQMYSKYLLMIDLRTAEEFEACHLPDSISIPATNFGDNDPTPELLQTFMNPRQWRQRKRNFVIIINSGTDFDSTLEFMLRGDGCKEVNIIENPHIFFNNYSDKLCRGVVFKNQLPSEILFRQLYLGSEKQALDPSVIDALQITHVVNASKAIKNAFEPEITYMNAYISDRETEYIDAYFAQAFEFINEALSNHQNKVLVHCGYGVSRSASLVIMYLMKYWKKGYEETYEYVKECREIVEPNEGFKTQLMKFDQGARSFFKRGSANEQIIPKRFQNKLQRNCA